ncbi:MAG TPA: regulatory protein RecX [Streptosporangiaceae bacterium]|nr:regulatory protein RecX [Streptosporangiaceae bacterium]
MPGSSPSRGRQRRSSQGARSGGARSRGAGGQRSSGPAARSGQDGVGGATTDTGADPDLFGRPDSSGTDSFARAGSADPPADPESVARLICLRLLTAAPRTRAQLAEALRRRGVPQDAAETVLSRFTEVGLIDDATFAAAWVESRHYGRGLGRRALAAELGQRGVPREDIDAAVSQLSPEAEHATALALVEKRLAGTAGQPYPARVKRLVGMLARKGYSPGLAYGVVKEALDRERMDGASSGSAADDGFDSEFAEPDDYAGEDVGFSDAIDAG